MNTAVSYLLWPADGRHSGVDLINLRCTFFVGGPWRKPERTDFCDAARNTRASVTLTCDRYELTIRTRTRFFDADVVIALARYGYQRCAGARMIIDCAGVKKTRAMRATQNSLSCLQASNARFHQWGIKSNLATFDEALHLRPFRWGEVGWAECD